MHLLLIHQAYAGPDQPGGTRHFELARHVVRAGGQATILTSDITYLTGRAVQPAPVLSEGVEIRRIRSYSAYHRSFAHRGLAFASFAAKAFRAALSVPSPTVVMGTAPPPLQAVSAYLVARRRHVPFVYEIRDLFWDYISESGMFRAKHAAAVGRKLEALLCRRADRVVINSPGFMPYVRACGTDESKIVLVPNGVDTSQFSPCAADRTVWRPYGCEDKFIALYAGALGMLNDLETLLEAAGRLTDLTDVRICLMGDGKERPRLEQYAREHHLPNVVFVPPQPKYMVPAFMASADVCVATLRRMPVLRTVYPNKVFDYLACGRPVVLGIDGEIRKVVEAAGAGIYVEPGDANQLAEAIRTYRLDPAARAQAGLAARSHVTEHFDRTKQAQIFSDMLSDLARQFRRRH